MNDLHQALEFEGTGVWRWDAETRRVTWSVQARRLFGLSDASPEEWTGADVRRFIHPADVEQVCEHLARARADRAPFQLECRIVQQGQLVRWLSVQGRATVDDRGKVLLLGTCRDITERRAKDHERRQLAAIVEMMREGVTWYDRDARFIYANAMAQRLFHRSLDQLVGRFAWEVLPIDETDGFVQAFRQAVRENAPVIARLHYPQWKLWFECQFDPHETGVLVNFRDITEVKRMETENLEFIRLVHQSTDCIAIASLDRRISFMNEAGQKLLGVSLEAYRGRDILDLVAPSQRELGVHVQQFVQSGESWEGELLLRHPGSEAEIPVRSSVVLIREIDGTPLAFAIVSRDLREQKAEAAAYEQLMEDLARSERRFRRLLDSGIIGICVSHTDGRISAANAKFLEYLGFTQEDLQAGRIRWDELTPPEWAHVDVEAMRELMQFGITQRPWEKEFFRKDGSRIALATGGALITPDEAVIYLIDVSERKSREREIDKLVQLIEESSNFINISGLDGKLLFLNEAGRHLLGLDPSDPLPASWTDFMDPGEKTLFVEVEEALVRTGRWQGEMRLRNLKTGALTPTWRSIFALRDRRTGEVFARASITQDLTAQKELEKARERLIGMVGHDLRSPVAAIRLSSELLCHGPDVPDPVRQSAVLIKRSADRMARMISQLLDFTRTRLGNGLAVFKTSTDLGLVCREIIAECSAAHPMRQFVFQQEVDAVGKWDADRLAEIVSNLLGNALQYGSAKAPIRVTITGAASEVLLEVHNQGAPIPPDMLPFLFDPFRRGDTVTPGKGNGSLGLGLYITREIVLAHGGEVSVRSAAGEGTSFIVRLPRAA